MQLDSPYGIVRVQVVVTDRVQGKQLYMPLNSVTEPVNRLTSSHLDRATHTPAYKEISVNMTVLPEKGPTPLPRQNFRYGNRTPQHGVEMNASGPAPTTTSPAPPADKLVQIETMRPT